MSTSDEGWEARTSTHVAHEELAPTAVSRPSESSSDQVFYPSVSADSRFRDAGCLRLGRHRGVGRRLGRSAVPARVGGRGRGRGKRRIFCR